MRTLFVPCAGRSSRFPSMRPKWLLTHPDGRLMINKALEGCDMSTFSKVVFVIVKEHDEEFEAGIILRQTFAHLGSKLEVVVLPAFTSGQAETIFEALQATACQGAVLIKDSDNFLAWDDQGDLSNYVVTGHLARLRDVTNTAAKSYVRLDKNGLVLDIIEKQVISETFCAGAYQFRSAEEFCKAFTEMSANSGLGREAYVSHVIAWMIAQQGLIFHSHETSGYEDWGTLKEWRTAQKKFLSVFCDVDGVIVKNVGQFGSKRWENALEPIEENLKTLKEIQARGAQIILLTARGEEFREKLQELLAIHGLRVHAIVTGCYHSQRLIINDFAPTNPFPSCSAVSIPRDALLAPYLQDYLS